MFGAGGKVVAVAEEDPLELAARGAETTTPPPAGGVLGPRAGAPAEHHGVMLAAAAGILFGVCNVASRR